MKNCEGCDYKKESGTMVTWSASIPYPCENCIRNSKNYEDNYHQTKSVSIDEKENAEYLMEVEDKRENEQED